MHAHTHTHTHTHIYSRTRLACRTTECVARVQIAGRRYKDQGDAHGQVARLERIFAAAWQSNLEGHVDREGATHYQVLAWLRRVRHRGHEDLGSKSVHAEPRCVSLQPPAGRPGLAGAATSSSAIRLAALLLLGRGRRAAAAAATGSRPRARRPRRAADPVSSSSSSSSRSALTIRHDQVFSSFQG